MNKIATCLLLALQLFVAGCHDDSDGQAAAPLPETGEVTLMSSATERSFYLIIPEGYDPEQPAKPLLFAYHGTGGSHDLWLEGYYDLVETVGDEAIIVLPQALPGTNDVNQWNYAYDFEYFEDMLAYLEEHVNFDRRRVFVTGHSSGAGMAHELGCNYGDRIRGIAPHSGILRSTECVGSVAVLQTHGEYDTLVPAGTGEAGHNFWVLYNGFEYESTTEGVHPSCIDHSLGSLQYPVQWCLHQEGEGNAAHDWPGFASAATWEFFSSLSSEDLTTDPPPGGGNSRVANLVDTTVSFTLRFPATMRPVTQGSIGLYPGGSRLPLSGGPNTILRLSFDPGTVVPNGEYQYTVPIKYANQTFPGTYAFAFLVYVVDGGNPIPYVGRDLIALVDVNVVDRNTPVIIDTPLQLSKVGVAVP